MQITSYFVGISLNSLYFADLFVELQKYLSAHNNIESCVELQNILSLHITFYYFDKEMTDKEKQKVYGDIERLRKNNSDFKIFINDVKYFWENRIDYLCYLRPSDDFILKNINAKFASKYMKSTVIDNTYSYIPHVTLFKIKDKSLFKKHRTELEKIINKHLSYMKEVNAFKDFNFFSANSKFHPEIQIIIY